MAQKFNTLDEVQDYLDANTHTALSARAPRGVVYMFNEDGEFTVRVEDFVRCDDLTEEVRQKTFNPIKMEPIHVEDVPETYKPELQFQTEDEVHDYLLDHPSKAVVVGDGTITLWFKLEGFDMKVLACPKGGPVIKMDPLDEKGPLPKANTVPVGQTPEPDVIK